jgi:large subunit ribosomal protein L25
MEDLLEHHAFVFQVEVEGKEVPVQLLEVQYDSIGEKILHTDLGRISLSEQIEVSVPVEVHGEAAGVREEGGVLEVIHHELTITCLPGNVPEDIRVEVADLNIGDDLRIADIEFPEGVKPVDDPDEVVVTCARPTEMITEEEEALTEEFMAEPEVIGREEELPGEEEDVESDGEE